MGNKQNRVLDGVEYHISQNMVRVKQKGWLEWFATKVFARYVGIPVLSILSPILYVLAASVPFVQQILNSITWIFTPWLDQALVDVKHELVKDVQGKRVLDVGSGGGDWIKYLPEASSVTELEPDKRHFAFLSKTVDRFRQEHPSVNVNMVNAPLEEFRPPQPFDVSLNR
jgi:hypothetical protein